MQAIIDKDPSWKETCHIGYASATSQALISGPESMMMMMKKKRLELVGENP